MPDTKPKQVYKVILDGFEELGKSDPKDIHQTILLRDCNFVGQRFRCDDIQAVWMTDDDFVAFYDEQNILLTKVRLDGGHVKKAA